MRTPRIYLPTDLAENSEILLPESAFNHVVRVLRMPLHASLTLFNGKGGEYSAIIAEIKKKSCTVKIEKFNDRECESHLNLHLAQAIIHNDKMDLIIQKSVELGVTEITPIITEFTDIKIDKTRLEKKCQHWQNIIIHSAEQCGRNRLPILHDVKRINEFVENVANETKIILHPYTESNPLKNLTTKNICVLIGPEGGFSNTEFSYAQQKQFLPLKLGSRILRAETAAISSLALLQAYFGDL